MPPSQGGELVRAAPGGSGGRGSLSAGDRLRGPMLGRTRLAPELRGVLPRVGAAVRDAAGGRPAAAGWPGPRQSQRLGDGLGLAVDKPGHSFYVFIY